MVESFRLPLYFLSHLVFGAAHLTRYYWRGATVVRPGSTSYLNQLGFAALGAPLRGGLPSPDSALGAWSLPLALGAHFGYNLASPLLHLPLAMVGTTEGPRPGRAGTG